MKEFLTMLLPYLLEGGFVATITFLLTMNQVKRGAKLKNDGTDINNQGQIIEQLKEAISLMREESLRYKEEANQSHLQYLEERMKNENLREENTAIKMMVCTHAGCVLRNPAMGQGDRWYGDHKEDPALGCDYEPINQLLKAYGKAKKETENA